MEGMLGRATTSDKIDSRCAPTAQRQTGYLYSGAPAQNEHEVLAASGKTLEREELRVLCHQHTLIDSFDYVRYVRRTVVEMHDLDIILHLHTLSLASLSPFVPRNFRVRPEQQPLDAGAGEHALIFVPRAAKRAPEADVVSLSGRH